MEIIQSRAVESAGELFQLLILNQFPAQTLSDDGWLRE